MQNKNNVWNRGVVVGERIALSSVEAQSVLKLLNDTANLHDACLFATAIDSMLRCSDLLQLRVGDVVASNGRVRWRQKKTGRNVFPVLTATTQDAISAWVELSGKSASHFLFTREKPINAKPISATHYRSLIKSWVQQIGLSPDRYSTHSLRRTKPHFLYRYGYSDLEHIARLLGHSGTQTTSRYLGIEQREAENHALAGDLFTADPHIPDPGHPLLRELLKPQFLDLFIEAFLSRLSPKTLEIIDENTKKGRE